jgi:type VI secretion system protein ImpK
MTPTFADAVDPIILEVLDVVDEIAKNPSVPPAPLRVRVQQCFRAAGDRIGQRQGWELAKYALACWADELLIQANTWDGATWWASNKLEFEYFNTAEGAIKFFLNAREAASLTRNDPLEVYFICVVLGFQGFYTFEEEAAFTAGNYDLPPHLSEWLEQTGKLVQVGQGIPNITATMRPEIAGARPLEAKYDFIGAGLLTIVLLAICGLIIFFLTTAKTGETALGLRHLAPLHTVGGSHACSSVLS